jgi:hypothetical protein
MSDIAELEREIGRKGERGSEFQDQMDKFHEFKKRMQRAGAYREEVFDIPSSRRFGLEKTEINS